MKQQQLLQQQPQFSLKRYNTSASKPAEDSPLINDHFIEFEEFQADKDLKSNKKSRSKYEEMAEKINKQGNLIIKQSYKLIALQQENCQLKEQYQCLHHQFLKVVSKIGKLEKGEQNASTYKEILDIKNKITISKQKKISQMEFVLSKILKKDSLKDAKEIKALHKESRDPHKQSRDNKENLKITCNKQKRKSELQKTGRVEHQPIKSHRQAMSKTFKPKSKTSFYIQADNRPLLTIKNSK